MPKIIDFLENFLNYLDSTVNNMKSASTLYKKYYSQAQILSDNIE